MAISVGDEYETYDSFKCKIEEIPGLTKTSQDDARTPSLGLVSHQVDDLGAITVSDARMP